MRTVISSLVFLLDSSRVWLFLRSPAKVFDITQLFGTSVDFGVFNLRGKTIEVLDCNWGYLNCNCRSEGIATSSRGASSE